jgi:hypothetical protein
LDFNQSVNHFYTEYLILNSFGLSAELKLEYQNLSPTQWNGGEVPKKEENGVEGQNS